MPEMTGVELSEVVRKIAPDITCVLLTGYAEQVRTPLGWEQPVRELIDAMKPPVARSKSVRIR